MFHTKIAMQRTGNTMEKTMQLDDAQMFSRRLQRFLDHFFHRMHQSFCCIR